ncbi:GPI ethanolamine phosphate transferase 2 [Spatholobus suberectus]|nr:GPI ethanolamine phosphate transferase 2 [Spatholobus suberectus]
MVCTFVGNVVFVEVYDLVVHGPSSMVCCRPWFLEQSGGFLDVAFNFNTQACLDDNLLGWKMVMHGDDTWLKLFPGLFERQDGVSSFFVSILHYLGLDHVGHIGGHNSVLMASKLSEMDEVVKMIHINTLRNLENDQGKTLLVVVSDHGMTESGNHGGSSYEEIDSIALFIGPKTHASDHLSSNHDTIFQVDIAPILALLFGVPIPKNNIGVLISQMVDSLTGLFIFYLCLSIYQKNEAGCMTFFDIHFHQAYYMLSNSTKGYNSIIGAYHEILSSTNEWLSHKATDKPNNLLVFGVAVLIISCLILLGVVFVIHKEVPTWEMQDLDHYVEPWKIDELLLQQSINVMLVLLLFIQFLANMLTFSSSGSRHKQWVEITALYNLGMASHFALGNSNTLATIDVAGAFIVMSPICVL